MKPRFRCLPESGYSLGRVRSGAGHVLNIPETVPIGSIALIRRIGRSCRGGYAVSGKPLVCRSNVKETKGVTQLIVYDLSARQLCGIIF